MTPAIITLTTDFGTGSPYVAELKGAILSIAPQSIIVDITHAIPPRDVFEGALVLGQVAAGFPAASIHVAVVDPGVGSDRRILLATVHGSHHIAPDNGLLTLLLDDQSAQELRIIDKPSFWRQAVSPTFHGRDIMAPVAAHLARGAAPEALASLLHQAPVLLALPKAQVGSRMIAGEVMMVDSFGNLLTNIHVSLLEGEAVTPFRIVVSGRELPLVGTYADGSPGDVVSLIGSRGWLEIAVVEGHAARTLHAERGWPVRVAW